MALHFSTQCTHSVEPLSWPCSLPSSAGAAVSGTQEGNFSISQAKNLRVLLHHHSHHPPWAPFCDFLVHTQVYVHNTHTCVLHLCLVVLEPFDILHSFSFLFIVTVSVLPWKYRMFPFSYYLTLMLLCLFLFYKIKFQLFSHHCKPQLFLLFMQYSLLLSCSLFLK